MTRVAFVVNGPASGPMGERARAFASRMSDRYETLILYRSPGKVRSIFELTRGLLGFRPRVAYVLDIGYSGIVAGFLSRVFTRQRIVVDTGDAITELGRSMGRGRIGVALTAGLERFSLRMASRIVVRGTYHAEWLRARGIEAEVVQDGVETSQFRVEPDLELRRSLGLENVTTVGLVGSSQWNPTIGMCYGWDLVEALGRLRDRPVHGVMIGDGTGIDVLKRRCRDLGIEDRISFLGRIPYQDLPRYLSVIDVCLSTQTNDLVGQVRTTGKLPLYLASGRFILASNVGEAARVLPPEMLVDFAGRTDPEYPTKLAERIETILSKPDMLRRGREESLRLARRFEYDILAAKVGRIIDEAAA